ncbi:hypothetical protein BZL30_4164 [Mycobacterium kansasii]|uniref:Uncharacterized protein n=1 Tax=Mycobacterium kansasii TaxID=1768 RepID=A0A1V3X9G7_MYCKA|nr:hypothetical protein BZL30_4164 [Mycobacterium kansasii]
MTEESRRGRARVPAGYSCGTAHIPVSTPGTAARGRIDNSVRKFPKSAPLGA